jgi:hypothetical protein
MTQNYPNPGATIDGLRCATGTPEQTVALYVCTRSQRLVSGLSVWFKI